MLKRYDFESKMNICQAQSKETMSIHGLADFSVLKVFPWELETFALFSVNTFKEYSDHKFEDKKGKRQFVEIINAIKNYRHPKFEDFQGENSIADYILIVTGLNQFQIQESIKYKIYRYSYIFNFKNLNVNMQQQFIDKFGCEYADFLKFGFIIQCLFSREVNININNIGPIYDYLLNKYKHVMRHLLIDRENYISLQGKTTKDITQYVYGFKYFYQFPFITYNQKIYLPLPHLIMQSVTSSLLFRMTEGNDTLRQFFGKEVLESYILQISGFSTFFNEVVGEFSYRNRQNMKRTLDIMIRKGSQCLMLDSKSMSPRISLRNLTEQDIEHTINRIVESVIQVYKHISQRFQQEYNPFCVEVDYSKENIFGAVILFEDSYIRRNIIMMKVAERLNMDLGSKEYKYLCSNVKLISLYEYESMIFKKLDVFQLLTNNRENSNKWFDITFINSSENGEEELVEDISKTIENMQGILGQFSQELLEEGLITR